MGDGKQRAQNMATVTFGGGDRPAGTVSKTDLVIGMQLLRAVNMQSIRLQLAMLRRDRQPTMESLDSLVAMDREIEHFIEGIASQSLPTGQLHGITELVATQKRALAEEKLYLTAGADGPRFRPREAQNPVEAIEPPTPEPSEYRPANRWIGWALAGLVLLSGGAAALWFSLGSPALFAGA